MNKMEDIYPLILDAFSKDLSFKFPIRGESMLPLLKTGDFVTLSKINRKIKKGDILLYRRDNGQFVLHRVRNIKNNTYVFVGDHQRKKEYGIKDINLIGIVISYEKNGNLYKLNRLSYKIYKLLVRISLLRWIFGHVYHEKKI